MKSILKSINAGQAIALAAAVCMSIAFLTSIYFFRQLSNSDLFDFTPLLVLLAVAVPASIFGLVFVQVRANAELQAASKSTQLPVNFDALANRAASNVQLERPAPAKDPFESL